MLECWQLPSSIDADYQYRLYPVDVFRFKMQARAIHSFANPRSWEMIMNPNETTSAEAQQAHSEKGKMPLQTGRPKLPTRVFPPRRDYASVSIKDLLDAREAYHVYLSELDNVVGTAIGRYLINKKDWYATNPPDRPRPADVSMIDEPRTLTNSVVRPWSWPAVLVFVKKWQEKKDLGGEVVPKTLYLPDGRVVPTCVVETTPDQTPPPPALGPFRSSELLGGDYSCFRIHQGEQAMGTIACLVRKSGSYYALTNRHVSGGDGEIVQAFIRGNKPQIGRTSDVAVDRKPFSDIFPSWGNRETLLTLDAGLIKIDDIRDWTSQAFGIGEIGEVFNATDATVTLDLISCPVRAFGGFSGSSLGEIKALFFRYESNGTFEYATDVLIGPRTSKDKETENPGVPRPFTHPGDSGTLWFYDPAGEVASSSSENQNVGAEFVEQGLAAPRLRPIAMQWGGQRVRASDGTESAYAIGSFLSSICRSLDVEVVRDWSLGHDEYWGKIGHFAIGWKACDQLSGNLSDLMKKNQTSIGFSDDSISDSSGFKVDRTGFVPLADVPDYIWVTQQGTHPNEPIQHFADIDIYDIDGGPSLLDQCAADPKYVAASKWKEYFDGFAAKGVGPEEGALPFRVWQIWDAMVEYLGKKDVMHFVAAAGVLAHYVGDASQPLHCSYMHHGVPPMVSVNRRKYPVPRDSDEFKEFKTTKPAQIHGIYEETMLEIDTAAVLSDVDAALAKGSSLAFNIASGHDAGVSVITLMKASQTRLAPMTIIDADDPTQGPKARATLLWNNKNIRKPTIESLADSVTLLSALWTAAWEVGQGDTIAVSELKRFEPDGFDAICRREKSFVPSLSLDDMAAGGKFEP
jgi:hypothetical protein